MAVQLKKRKKPILRYGEVPVTQDQLKQINRQLSSLTIAVRKGFSSNDKRFKSNDKRFESIDRKFEALEKKIDFVHADLMSEIHKVRLAVEDQAAQNRVVMDGFQMIYEELKENKRRTAALEAKIFGI